MKRVSIAGFGVGPVWALALALLAGAGPLAADDLAAGKAIAEERCASCHALAGPPTDLAALAASGGPDLSYAGTKFRADWLAGWLAAPRRIRPAGHLPFRYTVSTPGGDRVDAALLPSHPKLAAAEAKAVAAYLMSLKREINPFPVAAAAGEIRAEVHFDKILPCGGCHQARPGKGGVSGPELYTAAHRLERPWTFSFMADPVYWTKSPMPKSTVRSDQLAALADYLFAAEAGEADATLGAAVLPAGAEHRPSTAVAGERRPSAAPTGDRAATLYLMLCSQCHGVTGNGKGINAPSLFVAPRDHSSPDEMGALTDERIFAAIKRGGPAVGKSALMPSWGAVLADDDVRALVAYLRRLSGTSGDQAVLREATIHAKAR